MPVEFSYGPSVYAGHWARREAASQKIRAAMIAKGFDPRAPKFDVVLRKKLDKAVRPMGY